jgi:hypothetical protein
MTKTRELEKKRTKRKRAVGGDAPSVSGKNAEPPFFFADAAP